MAMTEEQIIAQEIERRKKTKKKKVKKAVKKKVVKKVKEKKPALTEEELVRKYAKRVMMNSRYHNRVDGDKFKGLEKTDSVNKSMWMDTDFFFSVVFQSADQKHEFLRAMKIEYLGEGEQIQIVNGLTLAESLGIKLTKERAKSYPTGNIDLMPYVLDNETLE